MDKETLRWLLSLTTPVMITAATIAVKFIVDAGLKPIHDRMHALELAIAKEQGESKANHDVMDVRVDHLEKRIPLGCPLVAKELVTVKG